ncbi:MAG: hypothetical protein U0797_28515 [Gemmataceae bacterium]
MRLMIRLLCCFLVGALWTAFLVVPWLITDETLELGRDWLRQRYRHEAIATRDEAVLRRLVAKREAVVALIAGQVTFADAVERFRQLQGLTCDGLDEVLGPYRGAPSGDEALSANVLGWAIGEMKDRPNAEGVIAPLVRERRAFLASRKAAH